jgi:prepilin-type N-terminal cleavage/methylation domain-containing protein
MRRFHHGFTLVELLVVIAIIAVLISILLPSLARARAVATRVTCGNQMRQIAMAAINWAQEHKGELPPQNGNWDNTRVLWMNIDLSDNPPSVPDDGIGRLVHEKYLSTAKILVCPALSEDLHPGSFQRGSYFLNPHPGIMNNGALGPRFQKLSDFRTAPTRSLVTDFIYDRSTIQHADWKKRINQQNFAYSDGSVKTADSKRTFERLGVGADQWGRSMDTIGLGEYIAAGKGDPGYGMGSGNPKNPLGNRPSNFYQYDQP